MRPPADRIAPVWAAMTRAVREGERSPAAHVLARGLTGRGKLSAPDLVRAVRQLISYHRWGGPGVQSVAPLPQLLVDGVGNCTDMAVAVGTLASLMGHGVRWCVGWRPGGQLAHVWAQVDTGSGWQHADPTPGVIPGGRPLDVPGASIAGWLSSTPVAVPRPF